MARVRDVDWYGIGCYLAISFGLAWAVEVYLIVGRGVSFAGIPPLVAQWVLAAVMFTPALGAWAVGRFVTRDGLRAAGWSPGPWRAYAATYLMVPSVFAAAYGLTWALGLGKPDWDLSLFLAQVERLVPGSAARTPAAPTLLAVVALSSLTFAPLVNSVFAFGEELGWRGFLLPRLLPLGTLPALVLHGAIWGLWHAPVVWAGFNYPGHPVAGIAMMTLLCTVLGIFIGGLRLRYDSVWLASFAHGAINAQGYGVWRMLFPDADPLRGGATGVVGLLLWLIPALWVLRGLDAPRRTDQTGLTGYR